MLGAALTAAVLVVGGGSVAAPAPRPSVAVAACAACHDAPQGATPHLDGLARSYLSRQIQGFVTGTRVASVTGGLCAVEQLRGLQPVDLLQVVSTYADKSRAPYPKDELVPELLARGESLFLDGRPSAGVQACARCHGRAALGGEQRGLDPAAVAPRLAGQNARYLYDQLRSFRKGQRKTDYNGIMQRMVVQLTDDDFFAVAAWLSTLDPATVPPAPVVAGPSGEPPAKAVVCQVCHGLNGESMQDTFPKIAGLSRGYIAKQLHDIRTGRRTVDVMTPIASSLTEAEVDEIATWFSQMPPMRQGPYDVLKARRGESLFHNGNLVTGYPACMYCHGVEGHGVTGVDWAPGDVPRLAGQHPGYVQKVLRDFRAGVRANDHGSMMRGVAVRMTDQEIEDVSHYVYSLGDRNADP